MSDTTYGERIAQVRDERGLTQKQFAAAAGLKLRTLQDIESGKVKQPQRKNRAKIDAYLGLAQEDAAEYPPDVEGTRDLVAAYLMALSPERRTAERRALIQWLVRRDHP